MISNKAVGWMTLVIIVVAGIRIFAEEQSASELYGRGVHAYSANDYDTAVALLSGSIEKNPADPRPYYFRGLALAARHGLEAGLADFDKGADVEVNKLDQRIYDVNGALQRVQGGMRLALEKRRAAVRLAAAQRKKKQDRVRYEELKRREDIVLYDPTRPVKRIDLELPKVELNGQDPFSSGVAFTGGKEVAQAAPEPVEPGDETVAMPAEGGPSRDPFAAPGRQPAAKIEDPFGTPDPFGNPPPAAQKPTAEKEPDASNPFGDNMQEVDPDDPVFDKNVRPELPPSMNVGGTVMDLLGKTLSGGATNRDPFGESTPAVPPKKEAEPPVETPDADPFGDSGPAKKEAQPTAETPDADPFGDTGAAKKQPAEKKPAAADGDPFK